MMRSGYSVAGRGWVTPPDHDVPSLIQLDTNLSALRRERQSGQRHGTRRIRNSGSQTLRASAGRMSAAGSESIQVGSEAELGTLPLLSAGTVAELRRTAAAPWHYYSVGAIRPDTATRLG